MEVSWALVTCPKVSKSISLTMTLFFPKALNTAFNSVFIENKISVSVLAWQMKLLKVKFKAGVLSQALLLIFFFF